MGPKYRAIIAGCRTFTNYQVAEDFVLEVFGKLGVTRDNLEYTISGGAPGADTVGEEISENNGFNSVRFNAKWDLYGNCAGCLRNREMRDFAIADNCVGILIAFWDNHSPGTKNMITLAKQKGMMVFIKDITQYKEVA